MRERDWKVSHSSVADPSKWFAYFLTSRWREKKGVLFFNLCFVLPYHSERKRVWKQSCCLVMLWYFKCCFVSTAWRFQSVSLISLSTKAAALLGSFSIFSLARTLLSLTRLKKTKTIGIWIASTVCVNWNWFPSCWLHSFAQKNVVSGVMNSSEEISKASTARFPYSQAEGTWPAINVMIVEIHLRSSLESHLHLPIDVLLNVHTARRPQTSTSAIVLIDAALFVNERKERS